MRISCINPLLVPAINIALFFATICFIKWTFLQVGEQIEFGSVTVVVTVIKLNTLKITELIKINGKEIKERTH